jgi:hypothetical protein
VRKQKGASSSRDGGGGFGFAYRRERFRFFESHFAGNVDIEQMAFAMAAHYGARVVDL